MTPKDHTYEEKRAPVPVFFEEYQATACPATEFSRKASISETMFLMRMRRYDTQDISPRYLRER